MISISKLFGRKTWALLFIAAAIAGAVLIFWTLKGKKIESSRGKASPAESEIDINDQDVATIKDEILDDGYSKIIPSGMKAVNIPVSFFGDCSVLDVGDRVDIISTYYDMEIGRLHSEKIISAKEIIMLETGGVSGMENKMSLGGSIIPEDMPVPGTAIDMGNILVMTFFLKDEEILTSFTALEKGILYLALCPGNMETGRND